jgi:hypothetical protein
MLAEAEARKSELRAAIAALTASPQAAPEVSPAYIKGGRMDPCDTCGAQAGELHHEDCADMRRLASPQVQGGDAWGPVDDLLAALQGLARAINDGDDCPLKLSAEMLTRLQRARSPRGPLYAAVSAATPQRAPGVSALPAKWRDEADYLPGRSAHHKRECATELEAALASGPSGVDGDIVNGVSPELSGESVSPTIDTPAAAAWKAMGDENYLFGGGPLEDAHPDDQAAAGRIAAAVLAAKPQCHDIDAMVNRFLAWKLPKDFHPDAGISFTPYTSAAYPEHTELYWPVGTNLLTAVQAKAMFEHCLAAAPAAQDQGEGNAR